MKAVVALFLLIVVALVGCTSIALTREQRIADFQGCVTAGISAGINIFQIIADMNSANTKKATDAETAAREANALPACTKVGANAIHVINEHMKSGKVVVPMAAPK